MHAEKQQLHDVIHTFSQEQLEQLYKTTSEKFYNDNYWSLLRTILTTPQLDNALSQIAEVIATCEKELDRRKANG